MGHAQNLRHATLANNLLRTPPGALRIFRAYVIAAIALFSLAVPTSAQLPTQGLGGGGTGRRGRFTISGTVRDENGNRAMESVEVQLWNRTGGLTASTYTNASGTFSFIDVPPGNYYLQIDQDGYDRLRRDIESSDRVSLGIDLSLRPRGYTGDKVSPNSPTVSLRQLSIPRPARDAMERGLSLLHEKSDYKGALAQFQRAIKEYPQYYEAYAQIGLVYIMMGNLDKAEEALRSSIDTSQRKYVDALFALASLYSGQQHFGAAEMVAREAVELNSASVQANQEWARALHGLNRDEEAEKAALKAVEAAPQDAQTYLLLANIHLRLRKAPELVKDLDTFLQIAPNAPEADQARKMRQQVLEHMPN